MVKEGFAEGPRYRMTPCARLCRKFFAIPLMDNAILSSAYLCRRAPRKSDISCTRGCVDTRMDDRWTSDLGYGKNWKSSGGNGRRENAWLRDREKGLANQYILTLRSALLFPLALAQLDPCTWPREISPRYTRVL